MRHNSSTLSEKNPLLVLGDAPGAVEASSELLDSSLDPSLRLDRLLSALGLSQEQLVAKGVDLDSLMTLLKIEFSTLSSYRWINLDYLFEKCCHLLGLYEAHLDILGTPTIQATLPAFKKNRHPIWLKGRGLPLVNRTALLRVLGVNGFRQGTEFLLMRGLQISLSIILIYQLVESIHQKKINTLFDFFQTFMSSNETTFFGIFQTVQDPSTHGIVAIFFLPMLWGGVKALVQMRDARFLDVVILKKTQAIFEKLPSHFSWWHDGIAWVLPFCSMDKNLNPLVRRLNWDGRLDADTREILFNLLTKVEQRGGYTKIAVLHLLAKLCHGHHFAQLVQYRKYYEHILESLVVVKVRSYRLINANAVGFTEALKKRQWGRLVHITYAHYLKWSLGDSVSKKVSALMFSVKLLKIMTTLLLFFTIIATLIRFLNCPQRPGYTLAGGYADWSMKYTRECCLTFISVLLPGQPIDTLLRVLANCHFQFPIPLDFGGRGFSDGAVIAEIIRTLIANKTQIFALYLNGNAFGTVEAMQAITTVFPLLTDVSLLDFSENNLGNQSLSVFQILSAGLASLPQLQVLNLAGNAIPPVGMVILAPAIAKMHGLLRLDVSNNLIGASIEGMNALSQILEQTLQLQTLSLSYNALGGPGMYALALRLSQLVCMQSLFLDNNRIGNYSATPYCLDAIQVGSSIGFMSQLKILKFFSNPLGACGAEPLIALGHSLKNTVDLEDLDLEYSDLEWMEGSSSGTVALAKSFSSLTNLRALYLNSNYLGKWDSLGVSALADGILYLPRDNFLIMFMPVRPSNATEQLFSNMKSHFLKHDNGIDAPLATSPEQARVYLDSIPVDQPILNWEVRLRGLRDYNGTFETLILGLSRFTSLSQLLISNNLLDGQQIAFLANHVPVHLTVLIMYMNCMGDEGAIALSQAFRNLPWLVWLDFGAPKDNKKISDRGAIAIAQQLPFLISLRALSLSGNSIGSSGLKAIASAAPALKNLIGINLVDNQCGTDSDEGVQALGKYIGDMQSLEAINLGKNNVGLTGDLGTYLLAKGLSELKNFCNLDLSNNKIGLHSNQGTEELSRVLPFFPGAYSLHLRSNLPATAEMYQYRNSYIFIDQAPPRLVYITRSDRIDEVTIRDWDRFRKELTAIAVPPNTEDLTLSPTQAENLITSNGGYTLSGPIFRLNMQQNELGRAGLSGPLALLQAVRNISQKLPTVQIGPLYNVTSSDIANALASRQNDELRAQCEDELCHGISSAASRTQALPVFALPWHILKYLLEWSARQTDQHRTALKSRFNLATAAEGHWDDSGTYMDAESRQPIFVWRTTDGRGSAHFFARRGYCEASNGLRNNLIKQEGIFREQRIVPEGAISICSQLPPRWYDGYCESMQMGCVLGALRGGSKVVEHRLLQQHGVAPGSAKRIQLLSHFVGYLVLLSMCRRMQPEQSGFIDTVQQGVQQIPLMIVFGLLLCILQTQAKKSAQRVPPTHPQLRQVVGWFAERADRCLYLHSCFTQGVVPTVLSTTASFLTESVVEHLFGA